MLDVGELKKLAKELQQGESVEVRLLVYPLR